MYFQLYPFDHDVYLATCTTYNINEDLDKKISKTTSINLAFASLVIKTPYMVSELCSKSVSISESSTLIDLLTKND